MEKTIAELDGTLVLNYLEDDIEMLETVCSEEESNLDTSYDENQNPKLESKAVNSEGTPKEDKNLIVCLENRVLSPTKLVTTVDGSKTNDFEGIHLLAPEETTGLATLNTKELEGNGLKVKRVRSIEVTKDLDIPKAKKIKTGTTVKDLNTKNLNDPEETKVLKPKSKVGRPRGSGAKRLNAFVETSNLPAELQTSVRDITEAKGLKPKKLYGTVTSKDLKLSKPKRGRPKGSGAKKVAVSVVSNEANCSITRVKMTESQASKTEQEASKITKDSFSLPFIRKRGRPKGFKVKKVNIPISNKEIEPSKAKAADTKDLVTNLLNISSVNNDLDSSRSEQDAISLPSIRRRGRPKGFKVKKVSIPVSNKESEPSIAKESDKRDLVTNLLDISSVNNNLDSSNIKIIEAVGLQVKKVNASKPEKTDFRESGAKTDVRIKYLVPPKGKRGRPKSLSAKKDTFSVNTKNFRDQGLKSKILNIFSDRNEYIKEADNNAKASKPKELELGDLGASSLDFAISNKNAEHSKSKKERPKGLVAKKDTFSVNTKNFKDQSSESKKLNISLDKNEDIRETENNSKAFKLKEPEVRDLGASSLDVVLSNKNVEHSKSKKGRPKGLVAKKDTFPVTTKNFKSQSLEPKILNVSFDIKGAENNSNTSQPRELEVEDLEANLLHVALSNKTVGHSKSKRGRPKGLVTKKSKAASVQIDLELSKAKETTTTDDGPRKVTAPVKLKDLEPSQSKMFKTKNVETKKVNTLEAIINLDCSESRASEGKQQNSAIETIDLELLEASRGKTKHLGVKKLNIFGAAKLAQVKINKINDVKSKQLDASRKTTKSRSSKPKETGRKGLEVTQQNDVVEVIDLLPPKPKRGRPKCLISQKVSDSIATTDSEPSKAKESDEVIDLELPTPEKGRGQDLGVKKPKVLRKNKDLESPKTEERENGSVNGENKSAESSKHKETDGKGVKKFNSLEENKEFKFPKPKKVKTSGVKKLNPFVATKDTKPAKPDGIEGKNVELKHVDTSVETKDVEPPKPQNAEMQNLERKSKLCTVGTQTIEIPEEVPTVSEVKSSERKISVSSVGTQVLESPKFKGAEVKDLGRKSSVDTVEIVDLDTPEAKSITSRKKLGTSMGIKPSESNSLNKVVKVFENRVRNEESVSNKVVKVCENRVRNDQTDDEFFKVEEIDWNSDEPRPISNPVGQCPELGVKYESLEQIHTEFKYESQSETEEMMKKRRGKHGGPMRGRRRGFNKIEDLKGQTTIDSFFKIVDLNGQIHMKGWKQIFKCDHCLYVGNSKANLERHSLIHRNPEDIIWFHCTECPYKSKYEHQLKSHFLIHMKPDQIQFFQCPHCEVKCSRKHNLNNHIKSIHSDREYSFRCAECKYSTFSKDRLVAHIKKHSREVHACTLCKFVTKRKEYLQSHFKMKHMDGVPRPFPCDTCSYKGKTKRELDRHYDRMHNKEQLQVYQCNLCSFNSIYKKNLEFHLLHMHNNSEGFQKFICGHCQKTFSYKNGLKVHIIRCHVKLPEDAWHKCLECKYKSKDVATLKRHIKRNHGAPRLHCKQCSFATNRQTSMEAHMKTHETDDGDILKCPECPYRILQMSSFLYHMKVIHGKPISSKDAERYYLKDD